MTTLDHTQRDEKKRRPLTPAEQKLVAQTIPFVSRLARRAARRYALRDLDQLTSVGSEAAIDAVRTFDPARGTPFEVFAFKRVVGAMRRESAADRFGHLHVAIVNALAADDDMASPPADLTLDEALEDSPEKARERAVAWIRKQAAGMFVASLQVQVQRTRDGEADVIARQERRHAIDMLKLAIEDLDEQERHFVRRFYEDGATLEAIAQERRVVVRTVTRVADRVKTKLAKALRKRGVTAVPPSERPA